MKLKYVGLKDRETAFADVTGIVWEQGSEHEVSAENAAKMLKHPDVFAVVEDKRPKALKPAEPAAVVEPATEAAQEAVAPTAEAVETTIEDMRKAMALIDLEATSGEALRDYAKQAGIKVHHKAGDDKVREALAEFIKGE